MHKAAVLDQTVRFSDFEVDPRAGELRQSGRRVRLQDKPLQVLLLLVSRPGQVVTRDELHQALWTADTFVDFEHGLNTAIRKLRRALGDSAETPRFIETLPRHGYRFVAAVRVPESATGAIRTLPPPVGATRRRGLSHPWVLYSGALALLALLAALVGLRIWKIRASRPSAPAIRSLAVLPLENLTGDPDEEYLSDGLTDELITDLAQLPGLRVISRTSVRQYKEAREPLPQIARTLGVDAIVEGTVTRAGNHVRVNVQLIDGASDRHLWAQHYETDFQDIVTLQRQLALGIAGGVAEQVSPSGSQQLRETSGAASAQAYQLYLHGLFALDQRNPEAESSAAEYFRRAIDSDPRFARAYASLAVSYVLLNLDGGWGGADLEFARQATIKSIALDSELAEPHTALAAIRAVKDYDWSGAESEFRRAIEINPGYALGHHWYAVFYLIPQGRFSEGLVELERARLLDPNSSILATDIAWTYYLMGENDRALALLQQVIAKDPTFVPAHYRLSRTYLFMGRNAEFVAESQKDLSLSGRLEDAREVGEEFRQGGLEPVFRRQLREAEKQQAAASFAALVTAQDYLQLGEKDRAIAVLSKAAAVHAIGLLYLKVDPTFRPLYGDPRFDAILHDLGLSQPGS